jgi:chromosome segregation ATPase
MTSLGIELLEINTQVELLEEYNGHLTKKKENIANDIKRLIIVNDELKREIETKTQLNEIRIHKKVKENKSEEINKLETNLQTIIKNVTELEGRVENEIGKIRMFSPEILKLNIELRHKENKKENVLESVECKFKLGEELKNRLEEWRRIYRDTKEKVINIFKIRFLNKLQIII